MSVEHTSTEFATAQENVTNPSQEYVAEQATSDDEVTGSSSDGCMPSVQSPPPEHVEPAVPDPFLVDDPEDPLSEDEESAASSPPPDKPTFSLRQPPVAAEEISLARPSSTPAEPALASPSVNVNKAVPPPPVVPDDDEEDEEDAPEIYLPQLVMPTMFLPIPNSDPLTTLLTKYISQPDQRPARDLSGDWQRRDFHAMVMSNSWRALARMARDRLVTTDPEDLNLVLGLWYLRLACLSRLRLFNQTSAECTNLFSVLNAIESPQARTYLFDRILPFELEVMQARLKYWAGDHMAYLDALYALLQKCKSRARKCARTDPTGLAMWQERGSRVCLIIASQLMEMKDFSAAASILEPLCKQGPDVFCAELRSSIARIYLQSGHLSMASKHFAAVAEHPDTDNSTKAMNTALLASAQGDWPAASTTLKALLQDDPNNFAAINNLSVALLSQGKLKEGIDVLENALNASPASVVVAEPFLFNLSTLYELRSATAAAKKQELLISVAKWSGDGLKTTCLKMPSN
ncbi:hypothetical protein PLICRDRAFT_115093 [Plicaturopsis crispa FD-325 SS-3]|nr:hypothetical protein PLICRDRAFT_115093 [Plicaturopsis crispa FD-325 SS-3]